MATLRNNQVIGDEQPDFKRTMLAHLHALVPARKRQAENAAIAATLFHAARTTRPAPLNLKPAFYIDRCLHHTSFSFLLSLKTRKEA